MLRFYEFFFNCCKIFTQNFYVLKVNNESRTELLPKDLESFFISWGNRIPQIPLNLISNKDRFGD